MFFLLVAVSIILLTISSLSFKSFYAKLVVSFLITTIIFGSSAFLFWHFLIGTLPSPDALASRTVEMTTKIYDRGGNLLYSLYGDENRTPVKLSEIPQHVRLATIAAEDSDFYSHSGISLKGIVRAVLKYASEGKLTGGSTITQQLVKNALLTPDRTVGRKIREILIAIAVEQKYTKDEILEMYLNEVSYGGTVYGIQEAARYYFDKNVESLSLAEAALLAGLPKSPSLLSPLGENQENTQRRQREVLDLMKEAGFISEAAADDAKKEEVKFASFRTDILAPHFVMYVREQLIKTYGEKVFTKGLNVKTTLDLSIQNYAQEAVASEVNKLKNLKVGNGASLVVNPQTGEILAMVGSKDYFSNDDGNVNVTLRPRQPGSSIKVVNYAYALTHGFTAASILEDTPVKFNIPGQLAYVPANYDGKFRGRLSLRSALAESRNIPAVKVLNTIGVQNMIETGRRMGVTSWNDPARFGLSLTLGGGEVTLYDLAKVYSTLANYGSRPELFAIEEIKDYEGNVIYKHKHNSIAALDPRAAFILTDILKDNDARAPAFGRNSALVVPNHREIAVKTGTSNNLRDNLTIGYNQNFLVAVWVGNNDNSPMSRVASGVTGASPIWNNIMTYLVADSSNHPWDTPEGLVQKKICGKNEWFLVEAIAQSQNCERPKKDAEKDRQPQTQ